MSVALSEVVDEPCMLGVAGEASGLGVKFDCVDVGVVVLTEIGVCVVVGVEIGGGVVAVVCADGVCINNEWAFKACCCADCANVASRACVDLAADSCCWVFSSEMSVCVMLSSVIA